MMRMALLQRTNSRFASDLWRRLATRHGEMSSMLSTDSGAPQHEAIAPSHHSTVDRFAKSRPLLASNRYHSSSTNANESTDASSTKTYSNRPATVAATTIPASSNSNDHRVKLSYLDQGIVHVQLSRPQKLNSLDMPMFESIAESASRLQNDRTVRVVILSGEGRAFCTGLDAKSVALEAGSGALERLLERPSGYGGVEEGEFGAGCCFFVETTASSRHCGTSRNVLRWRNANRARRRLSLLDPRLSIIHHGSQMGTHP
eukprot:CCRYP_010831-RA/>CCRYP_010831-RA protein AED:0.04 eAED:0.04 QI:142/1/1/1/0/0.33/3/712/258